MKARAMKKLEKVKNKMNSFRFGVMTGMASGAGMLMGIPVKAFDEVTVDAEGVDAGQAMGAVIGVILTIMRYVGVAMIIYGIYEIVMSIQNNQPEAKTKGIIMALSGVAMVAIKSLLSAFGITVG